jgi:RNA polymerase sigma factor (sigma-70 family)
VADYQLPDAAKRERIAAFIQRNEPSIHSVVSRFGAVSQRYADDMKQVARMALFKFLMKEGRDANDDVFPVSVVRGKIADWLEKERHYGFTRLPMRYWKGGNGADMMDILSLSVDEEGQTIQVAAAERAGLDAVEAIAVVRNAIRELTETEQAVVRHLFWDERTPSEIERLYGWSNGQSLRICAQAVRKLKISLRLIAS